VISDFEARLADRLGKKISSPVDVAPGTAPGADVRVVLGVVAAQLLDPDLGSRRDEVVPGDASPRRAMRMQCTVLLESRAKPADRVKQMKTLDEAIYALDAADFRSGAVLADGANDLGFLIREMQQSGFVAPLAPDTPDAPVAISVTAKGLFWPVGTKGAAGDLIGEIHFRGAAIAVEIFPAEPRFIAGSAAADLTIFFTVAAMVIKKGSVTPLPFNSVVLTLAGAGDRPAAGTLTGGTDGKTPALRIVAVKDGSATIKYTPPAKAAADELIVALDDGANGLGIEIGRAGLVTRSA
jgi:hypothetical protein